MKGEALRESSLWPDSTSTPGVLGTGGKKSACRRPFISCRLLADIELIHGHGYSPVDQTFQRIDDAIKTGIQHLEVFSRERLQHIVRRILARCRTSDSDFYSYKLRCSDRLDNRPDAVMSSVTALLLDSETPHLKVKIVVEKDQICGCL